MTGLVTARWGPQPTAWMQAGLPTWHWRAAPDGLLTRRQMREAGLCPGGAQPVAQVTRGRGSRLCALLWDRAELTAKRVATPAQLGAVAAALAARRRCAGCGRDAGYCLPRATGLCLDCVAGPGPGRATDADRDGQRDRDRDGDVVGGLVAAGDAARCA